MGQRRVVVLTAWLAVLMAGAAALAAVSHGSARTAWLGVLAALFLVAAVGLYWELAPHRYAKTLTKFVLDARYKRHRSRLERDWRADSRKGNDGRWQLELFPPGAVTANTSYQRRAMQVDATVRVTNEAGVFEGVAKVHPWGFRFVHLPDDLSSADGSRCPLAGTHHISWHANTFDGERTETLVLDALGHEIRHDPKRVRHRSRWPSRRRDTGLHSE